MERIRWGIATLRRMLGRGAPGDHACPDDDAPSHLTLRMDVTNRCSLACVQCLLERYRRELHERPSDMPMRVFDRIASEVMPHCDMVALSCEAEPTLHPEIATMIRVAARTREDAVVVATTNGMALTERLLATMLESPLAGLNVSIDGAKAETFARIRRRGSLEIVSRALERLVAMKLARGLPPRLAYPRLQINVTLMRSNVDELEDIAGRCRDWCAYRLTLQHVYAVEENGLAHESLASDPERSDAAIARCAEICRAAEIETTFPPPFRREEPASPARAAPVDGTAACEAPWRMVRIAWNGTVYPCDLWGRGVPGLGDLARQSFRDVWYGPEYRALRQGLRGRGPLHAVCSRCSMVSTDNLERLRRSSALVLTPGAPRAV